MGWGWTANWKEVGLESIKLKLEGGRVVGRGWGGAGKCQSEARRWGYSSDQKKVPVFIPYYGRATVHRLNLNDEKTAPSDPYYARSTRVLRPYRFCY